MSLPAARQCLYGYLASLTRTARTQGPHALSASSPLALAACAADQQRECSISNASFASARSREDKAHGRTRQGQTLPEDCSHQALLRAGPAQGLCVWSQTVTGKQQSAAAYKQDGAGHGNAEQHAARLHGTQGAQWRLSFRSQGHASTSTPALLLLAQQMMAKQKHRRRPRPSRTLHQMSRQR